MEDEIRIFLNHLSKEKKCSKNTLDAYQNDLSQMIEYLNTQINPDHPINSTTALTEDNIKTYILSLKNRGYAVSTIARKIAAARSFISYLAESGKADKELSAKLNAPRVNKHNPQSLTIAEIHLLLDETKKMQSPDAKRDSAMLELLYASGLLASEMMALNTSDVDLRGGKIIVSNRKGKSRVIPLDKNTINTMKDYLEIVRLDLLSSDKENALFLNQRGERLTRQGFWQIIQGYTDAAGLSHKVTPRTIRHSFAIHRLNNGTDLQDMQEMLGHANISTTKIYKQP